jgi:dTDP-3-amino-3,4,6-trideoxy-alpha-D-glucose transaminase
MTVAFLDLARLHASIQDELDAAWHEVVRESRFVGAGASARFETAFAAAHDAEAGAGCASGTDALSLALRALGVGPGDEVIVPSMTFVATAEAVAHVGATPVVVDVDSRTLLLDPTAVDAARTPATRAVIPVHLFGHVVPFDLLQGWRDSGLLVVEDAAQAHLATYQGEPVGTVGHATCFSFYPGKNLGAFGDAGLVLGPEAVMARVRKLRDHGRVSKYAHDEIGWCSRLDGLQAAVLEVKLRHLPEWTQGRVAAANRYRDRLGALLVPWSDGAVHHLLVVRVPADRRDEIQAGLRAAGVETGVHYPVAVSSQPAFAEYSQPCPNAETAQHEVLSLPMDPLLTTDEVDVVCDRLLEIVAS